MRPAFEPTTTGTGTCIAPTLRTIPMCSCAMTTAFMRMNSNAGIASMQHGWGACCGPQWDMLEDLMVATYPFQFKSLRQSPVCEHRQGTFIDIEDWPNEQYQLYSLGRQSIWDHCPDIIDHGNAHARSAQHQPRGASRVAVTRRDGKQCAGSGGRDPHVRRWDAPDAQVSAGCVM